MGRKLTIKSQAFDDRRASNRTNVQESLIQLIIDKASADGEVNRKLSL